jgi:hypothetical protein
LETSAFFIIFVLMKKNLAIALLLLLVSVTRAESLENGDNPPAAVSVAGPSFSLTPNPVTGSHFYVNLAFSEAQYPEAGIIINDVLGKTVYSYGLTKNDYASGRIRIDVADAMLDKGVYFVQVKSGDATKTLKLAIR